nr:immunoglobulin light chain junction region [Macaca mulatta]MOX85633.1 immunoglobulin light chain junction region [Macaca mulatta]MOX87594.1 immunoglobulin light chain junction region [Macaca mulatta]MOX87759.1 immunoglobulin light chain junction region [Macaca mulatta]MOX90894.1 immunoglobulin light chain junction region [Macaca mulatta]
CQQHNSYPYIF